MNDTSDRPDMALVLRLLDHVPTMLVYWDRDQRCRYANRAYERWFGAGPGALLGRTLPELLGPEIYAMNEPHIMAALQGHEQTFERWAPGPGDAYRHALATFLPDVVDGVVTGFFVQVAETTQLKRAEMALRDSERKFRTLAEASPFGTYRAAADGSCLYTNTKWQEIAGIGLAQSLGQGWNDTLHPEDREAVLARWNAAATAKAVFDMEFRLRRPDGEVRIVRSQARPLPAGTESEREYVGALEDVTDRRAAEQRLRASEAFLDRAGRIAGVGGWEVDLRTNSVVWSERTRRIHEVPADWQPTVQTAIHFYAPEARPLVEAALKAALDSGTTWDLELPLVTWTGRPIWVRAVGEAEYEGAVAVRLIGAFQDVTEQRQRRAELQHEQSLRVQIERQVIALDRLLDERGQMLDVLAHEVRQPLNNASAALQGAALALADAGDSVASSRLMRAQTVMGQVLASIDNTLAVASLLARPQPVYREDTDIYTLVAVAVADMPASERSRVRIERSTLTRTATMEMSLMRLALRNLLANALKYSPAGSEVILGVSDSDDPLALVLDVADGGPGIPADAVPRLFMRGAHGAAGNAPAKPGAGLGLGLYIVRRVMELHDGRVELARNTPEGVTMRLVIVQALGD